MTRHLRLLSFWLVLFAGLAAAPAHAQAPKVGDFYEDAVDIGFKVKMPKDWEFTPPQPGEGNLIGKYSPTYNKYINLTPDEILWLEAYLVKFDRRKPVGEDKITTDDEGNVEIEIADRDYSDPDLKTWVENNMRGRGFRVEDEKELKINKVPSTEYLYVGQTGEVEFHVYAMLYKLEENLEVAVVFNGPADSKKWRKYESAFTKMAKSFKPIEVEELELSGGRDGDTAVRSQKRAALEAECARQPGWELYETQNYFVITDNDDREFIKELLDRMEAIRAVYEELYPWEKADRLRAIAAQSRKEEEQKKKEAGEDDEPDIEVKIKQAGRTTSAISSREQSRCSVVRIFKNRSQYMEYGAPGGSAGYWSPMQEELVVYDDKAGGGRADTWATLNHEAFHQYIFYLYGNLSPHSWYNEGTGDFFAGYEYKHKKFILNPFAWRVQTIKQAIKDDNLALQEGKERQIAPLKKLVQYTQREYYGPEIGRNYAQGWSFIYFLRTGAEKASGWNPAWNGILDTYFETLASTEDLDKAVEVAFAGVDWDELENCWKDYVLKGL